MAIIITALRPETDVVDPVCGMTVDPNTSKHRSDYMGVTLPFLLGRLPDQIRGRPGAVPRQVKSDAAGPGPGGHRLHLPNASANPPDRPRKLPDLRDGART